ncbi:MAG: CoA-binding protein [Gemmatimonadota bacterium]
MRGSTHSEDEIAAIVRSARRIAVVGLSPNPARPSHEVASYLQQVGYEIIPVRPGVSQVLGRPAYSDLRLAGATGAIDIVNVFRRSEAIAGLVDDCIAIHPRLVWLQVGVQDEVAAARLEQEGIPVVMNRCLMVDHYQFAGV